MWEEEWSGGRRSILGEEGCSEGEGVLCSGMVAPGGGCQVGCVTFGEVLVAVFLWKKSQISINVINFGLHDGAFVSSPCSSSF